MVKLYSGMLLFGSTMLMSCSSGPKHKSFNPLDGCSVIRVSGQWRQAFEQSYKKYGVPPHVIMAFIYQESTFKANARPPSSSVLGIPTGRRSSAFGYPQAKDETWKWYQRKTGKKRSKRNRLPDAVDFIGWYVLTNHQRSGVSKWEAAQQYLAYHDGMGGYERGTHLKKKWLLKTANRVQKNAINYRQQLAKCFNY